MIKIGDEMQAKEKLSYLIEEYLAGEYTTAAFCDEYTLVYDLELEKSRLKECELAFFESICKLAERFSPYQEDIMNYDFFISESTFREKFANIIKEASG